MTVLALCAPVAAFAASTLAPQIAEAAADSPALSTFKAHHESVLKLVKRGAGAKKLQQNVDELLDWAHRDRRASVRTKRKENCLLIFNNFFIKI